MSEPLVDANVVLRFVLQDHPGRSPRSLAFFQRIERGEVRAHLSDSVIFESAFTLDRSYKQPRTWIREVMLALIEQPNVMVTGKSRWRRVFDLSVEYNIPLGDALNVEFMERNGITEIISFDRDFNRIPGITRIEP